MTTSSAAPSGAFVAETSFSRAPLNSRLPPVSPHRLASAPKRSKPPRRRDENDSLSDLEDESVELQQDEEVQEDEAALRARRRREGLVKEPLKGLSADLQEALIVEDLLFVLMVSRAEP